MKKVRNILLFLAVLVLLPLNVFAEEKINVYLFRRNGCGFCEAALSFFNSLDEEYKSYFNLVEKEVSTSKANSSLMAEVGKYLNVDIEGYTSSWDENIKSTIKKAYLNTDGSYQDVVAKLSGGEEKEDNGAAITIVVILVVVAGVAFLIYMAKEDSEEEKSVPEKKEAPVKKVASKKATTTSKKTSTTKKTTTTKKATTTKKKASTKK